MGCSSQQDLGPELDQDPEGVKSLRGQVALVALLGTEPDPET